MKYGERKSSECPHCGETIIWIEQWPSDKSDHDAEWFMHFYSFCPRMKGVIQLIFSEFRKEINSQLRENIDSHVRFFHAPDDV
jgi:hypothetical protein